MAKGHGNGDFMTTLLSILVELRADGRRQEAMLRAHEAQLRQHEAQLRQHDATMHRIARLLAGAAEAIGQVDRRVRRLERGA